MKKLIFGIMMALLLTSFAFAATTAQQTITVSVTGIAELSGVAQNIDLTIPATMSGGRYESDLTDNTMTVKCNMAKPLKVTALAFDPAETHIALAIQDISDADQVLVSAGASGGQKTLIANAIGKNGQENFELQAYCADIFAVLSQAYTTTLTYELGP